MVIMTEKRRRFELERFRFADDVEWLPTVERARINTPTLSLRAVAVGAWFLATVVSLIAVGFIPPSRRVRGKQSGLQRRMVRSAVHRWLAARAVYVRDFGLLDELPDGTLVRIIGRVRSCGTHVGRPSSPVEQITFTVVLGSEEHVKRYHLVCERGEDFDLVDRRGCAIRIQVADAQVVGPAVEECERPLHDLRGIEPIPWPAPLDQAGGSFRKLTMGTYQLAPGERLEVYGIKDRVVDRELADRLARQEPIRTVLRSDRASPLVMITC